MTPDLGRIQVELAGWIQQAKLLPPEQRREIVDLLCGTGAAMAAELWDDDEERP